VSLSRAALAARLAALAAETGYRSLKLVLQGYSRESLADWSRRVLARARVEILLEAPCPTGCLWVANHLSWIDPVALLSLRPSSALAKAEIRDYPLIGLGARRAGFHFVRREDTFSRAAAGMALARELMAGREFLLFPEGTTTRGEGLAPLYEGGIRLAYRLGVPVLPICLRSADAHYPWVGDEGLLAHVKDLVDAGGTRVEVHPGVLLRPEAVSSEAEWVAAIHRGIDPRSRLAARCA
jgi:1-acyl-sn-glycerol-3-phosphate acyltransferase